MREYQRNPALRPRTSGQPRSACQLLGCSSPEPHQSASRPRAWPRRPLHSRPKRQVSAAKPRAPGPLSRALPCGLRLWAPQSGAPPIPGHAPPVVTRAPPTAGGTPPNLARRSGCELGPITRTRLARRPPTAAHDAKQAAAGSNGLARRAHLLDTPLTTGGNPHKTACARLGGCSAWLNAAPRRQTRRAAAALARACRPHRCARPRCATGARPRGPRS